MTLETKPIKPWHKFFLLAVLLAAVASWGYSWYWPRAMVKIGGKELKVLVAESDRHRFQGLSNRKNLGDWGGMLFIASERGQHTMVMREMLFPIDIVWIDGGKIIDMAPNAQPEPGRSEAELTPYFARGPSTLVLELPAGFVEQNKLQVGDAVVVAR